MASVLIAPMPNTSTFLPRSSMPTSGPTKLMLSQLQPYLQQLDCLNMQADRPHFKHVLQAPFQTVLSRLTPEFKSSVGSP
jgi:hypothetical protein